MCKILLASTALIAMTSASAMAADITIGGSAALIYSNDAAKTADGGAISAEQDINFNFSHTFDNGMTAGSSFYLDESIGAGTGDNGAGWDDLNWTLSNTPLGTLKITPGGVSSNVVKGMNDKVNFAGEGSDITADGPFDDSKGTGTVIGITLPPLASGLTVNMEHGIDHFGIGASMAAGPATVNVAQIKNATTTGTTAGVVASLSGITLGYEQNKSEAGAVEKTGTIMGVKYTMGDMTLAYEDSQLETGSTKTDTSKQLQVSYTITPGISAVASTSEVANAINATQVDKDITELQLKVSF
jgi:hypothetical protein